MQINMQANLSNLMDAITAVDVQSAKSALDKAAANGQEFVANREAYISNRNDSSSNSELEKLSTLTTEAASIREEITERVLNPSAENSEKAMVLFKNEYRPKIEQAMEILSFFIKCRKNLRYNKISMRVCQSKELLFCSRSVLQFVS